MNSHPPETTLNLNNVVVVETQDFALQSAQSLNDMLFRVLRKARKSLHSGSPETTLK
jgi:hypothetical protein